MYLPNVQVKMNICFSVYTHTRTQSHAQNAILLSIESMSHTYVRYNDPDPLSNQKYGLSQSFHLSRNLVFISLGI